MPSDVFDGISLARFELFTCGKRNVDPSADSPHCASVSKINAPIGFEGTRGMTGGIEDPAQDKLEIVTPYITLADLKGYWVGLGVAIDWIAMRGKEMTLAEFDRRFDEGMEELVRLLADLPDDEALRIVRGENVDEHGPLVPVPSGIWRQTATSDANDAGKLYRLIGTDDDNEWEGAILSAHYGGYRKVQVSSDFILANWPSNQTDFEATPRIAVSQAKIRRLIKCIVDATPIELAPLTQREITTIVRRSLPMASRDVIREICRELLLSEKPGPRGARNPLRNQQVEELGERISAAQLPN